MSLAIRVDGLTTRCAREIALFHEAGRAKLGVFASSERFDRAVQLQAQPFLKAGHGAVAIHARAQPREVQRFQNLLMASLQGRRVVPARNGHPGVLEERELIEMNACRHQPVDGSIRKGHHADCSRSTGLGSPRAERHLDAPALWARAARACARQAMDPASVTRSGRRICRRLRVKAAGFRHRLAQRVQRAVQLRIDSVRGRGPMHPSAVTKEQLVVEDGFASAPRRC